MKNKYISQLIFLTGFLFLIGINNVIASELDKFTILDIKNKIYEVLVKKSDEKKIKYEKELPLDLLPFSLRNDEYYSIGTAFAFENNLFISAAHVFNLSARSIYKEVFLRDKNKKIYHVDKIVKYSKKKDFVVFTLKEQTDPIQPWSIKNPETNMKVYAVGNALGQGVVIRDGLYTSDTQEEENGEWSWIRFSAAASPGNSGGPLLSEEGKVIGVVLRKSENENLNFALSIKEVYDSSENIANIDSTFMYKFDLIDLRKLVHLKKEIALPLGYSELNGKILEFHENYFSHVINDIMSENKDKIFPLSPESDTLLHINYSEKFPMAIQKGKDNQWMAVKPQELQTLYLSNNGSITYGLINRYIFSKIIKPDNVSLNQFYSDDKLFMDIFLKGFPFSRDFGSEKIRLTSLGNSTNSIIFTDSYSRQWMFKSWSLEYNDYAVVMFLLPVPGGYVSIFTTVITGTVNSLFKDFEKLSNFIAVSYDGTLEEWSEFLKEKDYIPPVISDMKIFHKEKENIVFQSNNISFQFAHSLLSSEKNTSLELYFNNYTDNGEIKWGLTEIEIGEEKGEKNKLILSRHIQPSKEMNEWFHQKWKEISTGEYPYDETSFFKAPNTFIGTILRNEDGVLYSLVYQAKGKVEKDVMESKLIEFKKNIIISEQFKK